jgi:tRNA nucleotidyltransferase (CCA-adding enzyme)
LESDTDVDFFLVYPKSVERASFETLGLSLAEKALGGFAPRRRYAEHPYIEAEVDDITINAVPCYDVSKGEWKSSADRSPYHTRYMAEHLDRSLKAEVRVLKRFMRAQGLYGAEIRVRGFSGYACEVLTLKYGSFAGLLEAATEWEKGVVLSLEGGEEPAKALFQGSSFILLDPVDVTRNLGQAIAPVKVAEFVYASRVFLRRPASSFFARPCLSPATSVPDYLRGQVLLLRFAYRDKSEDILWGELWKSSKGLASHLERDGVAVLSSSVAAGGGKASMAFLVSVRRLPRAVERKGPEVFMGDALERFLSASSRRAGSWWIGDDQRGHVVSRAMENSPADLLKLYMKDPVTKVGFARGLAADAVRSVEVLAGRSACDSHRRMDREALRRLVGYRF